jgi:hypothetical protein
MSNWIETQSRTHAVRYDEMLCLAFAAVNRPEGYNGDRTTVFLTLDDDGKLWEIADCGYYPALGWAKRHDTEAEALAEYLETHGPQWILVESHID